MMRKLSISLLFLWCGLAVVCGQTVDYAGLKAGAEKLYAEKSFARANELYAQANIESLPPDEVRWVKFRRADTQWRAQSATNTNDNTKYEQAREALNVLVRDVKRDEEKDRVWVEVQESLGDFWWTRREAQNWGEAWKYYQPALDWWAGQSDLDTARGRYLNIVWNLASPPWARENYEGGYYSGHLSPQILEDAVKIAATPNDQARARYYLALAWRNTGQWEQRARVAEEFEAALRAGKASDWHDDALFLYAQWMRDSGQITQQENGNWQQRADYVKALELFRRLVNEYRKGETRYYDQATQQISYITQPTLGVSVPHVFLPESEIQFNLNWRNLKRVEFSLYRVSLTSDARFPDGNQSGGQWAQQINPTGRDKIKSWTRETKDDGTYQPGNEVVRLETRLPVGAYLVQAEGGGQKAQDVILVTDTALVVRTSGKKALVYYCHALTGAPLAGAQVKLWTRVYENSSYRWRELAATTNAEGLALFERPPDSYHYSELFAVAALSGREAFSLGYSSYGQPATQAQWRIYAHTDRPAYRPGETAQWKFTARQYLNNSYSTPVNQTLEYQINDPRGVKVADGKATLNQFGSAWGTLELKGEWPLGAYQVQFWDAGRNNNIGNASLFRLEEYKLPEYKVSVATPEVEGRKKAFRLGEKVAVTVKAEYYFGGAVANADVEVVVYQRPFYHYWRRPQEFSWYYDDLTPRNYYGGNQGQSIKQEKLKTDATGQATLTFDTPRNNGGQDLEYYIEARVTDASRREITGSDTVRVTRQRYYVHARPDHNLYRPNDLVKVNFKSLDANSNPVAAAGEVKVTRDYFTEIWLDPSGREVTGDELRRVRESLAAQNRSFPPAPEKDGKPWTVKFYGYQHEAIATQKLSTDDKGDATLSFTPPRDGFYRVAWSSPDKGASPVQTQAAVWVTTNRATDLGYRFGSLQIITDKDTYRVGERAPALLTSAVPDRYVLFIVEADDLDSYQVVHLAGTSQLVEIPVEAKHAPNIFLNALMVSDRQLFVDSKQLIVPPVEHFLNVEVKADREQYQPREEGTLNITTRDHTGRPVAAEIALGLIDESVLYIQQDTAGDPRQFYFGAKRQPRTQTQSTFQQKTYAKLVENPEKQLVDEKALAQREDANKRNAKNEVRGAYREWLDKDVGYILDGQEVANFRTGMLGGDSNFAVDGVAASESSDARITNLPVNGRQFNSLLILSSGTLRSTPDPAEPAVQVRNDFRSTAFWQPDVKTDANGMATVKVKYPDSLTRWKATARVITAGDQFGLADTATRTKQPLIVRLQAPRFFVAGDTVTISAVINNNTDAPVNVTPTLNAEGIAVTGASGNVTVPANGETRVDWPAQVTAAGPVKLKVSAQAGKLADAMERAYTAYEHGIEKSVTKSGKLRGAEAIIKFDIPRERRPETTNLTVQVAPSMAVTMLDALPYLIDYPYGCVEQTMSRFLPAAITAKTLKDLNLAPEDAMARVFGGIEPANAAATHPTGKRDLRQLEAITKQSLERLYSMQHTDGGWGWWKETPTDHFMTAYVVWGLVLARDAGIKIKEDVLANGVNYLDKELVEEEANPDLQAWLLHALASRKPSEPSAFQATAFANLWQQREKLNAYTRALLALAAHYYGYADKANTLIRNLENGVKIDNAPDTSIVQRGAQTSGENVIGTAHWGADGIYYRWSEGGVEATSFALRALLTIDPQNKLIEPVTNWLVKNRRGAQWSNTRDTALTILALNDYLRVTGEAQAALGYEITVNGQPVATKYLTGADVLSAPNRFTVSRELLRDGANEIKIRRLNGNGAVYFSVNAQYFSLEEPVKAAGNEIFVRREYYKLAGRPTLLKGYVYDRVPLRDGETVNSGDRVQVVVTIESKNNYEYLLFEDLKPAGLEAVQIRSGEPLYARELKSGSVNRKFADGNNSVAPNDYTSRTAYVYQELRDRKVALFIDKLPEGVWEILYDLRAETPGRYHALPLLGQAMYAPEIRANDDETRIQVR